MRRAHHSPRVSCPAIFGALAAAAIVANSGCADTMVPAPVAEEPVAPASGFPAGQEDAFAPVVSDDSGCIGFGCPGFSADATPVCLPGSPLSCYVDNCPNGSATTIVGTVYDPAGRNPLPDVAVYVPEDPSALPKIVGGTSSCTLCKGTTGDDVTFTFTDASGHFQLTGVPTGKNIPLVLQVGKWRRMIAVPNVYRCETTTLPSSGPYVARLPRNRTEGDMPQMAVLTGGCDNVACFLRSVGVDASEFSAPGAGGRVDVYQGLGAAGPAAALSSGMAGDCTTSACPLWSTRLTLEAYDHVFLGCECGEHDETKPASSLQAMHDWLDEGGQVFATHAQAIWFKNGPSDLQSIAAWSSGPASGATGPFVVNTTPPAQNLGAWLAGLSAVDAGGDVPLDPSAVSTSVTAVASSTQAWIRDISTANDAGASAADADSPTDGAGAAVGNVKLLTAGMPVNGLDASPPLYCGSVVFSDIHPGGGQALTETGSDSSSSPASVPDACNGGPLSPGDEALEFLLFDQPTCSGHSVLPPPNGITK